MFLLRYLRQGHQCLLIGNCFFDAARFNRNLPDELENIVRAGRVENLELCSCTQHPRDYHRDLRAEVTEWVCFNTAEESDLDAVRQYFAGVDRVRTLPRGSFIGYNRESGAELAGQLF